MGDKDTLLDTLQNWIEDSNVGGVRLLLGPDIQFRGRKRTAAQGRGRLLKQILRGLWAWARWVPGSPACTMRCLEAVKVSFQ